MSQDKKPTNITQTGSAPAENILFITHGDFVNRFEDLSGNIILDRSWLIGDRVTCSNGAIPDVAQVRATLRQLTPYVDDDNYIKQMHVLPKINPITALCAAARGRQP